MDNFYLAYFYFDRSVYFIVQVSVSFLFAFEFIKAKYLKIFLSFLEQLNYCVSVEDFY